MKTRIPKTKVGPFWTKNPTKTSGKLCKSHKKKVPGQQRKQVGMQNATINRRGHANQILGLLEAVDGSVPIRLVKAL